ncbi:Retrovirus-related Pol polyprotein from transposon opus Protease [Channa argus]|uniref:Retrovirus-related Pol polyprotein from transposon opus Protease n=1 Tax=Channa argus TaxID=215402 RepID=A0A6G1QT40_CHAAH|nr:Retrovirus-related Pol polyprotein from transposon opus Protease [Channa argus]
MRKNLFSTHSVSFLGFIISAGSMKMDPRKVCVCVVRDWPTSKSCKQLQRFLGFANFYRRLVQEYSTIAAPLHQLSTVKRPFCWSPAEQAFSLLKNAISSALTLPEPRETVHSEGRFLRCGGGGRALSKI